MFSQPAEFITTRRKVATFTEESGEQAGFSVCQAEEKRWKTGHAMLVVLSVRSNVSMAEIMVLIGQHGVVALGMVSESESVPRLCEVIYYFF